jgi:drug/metabolite transporter (DMT)-like permease
MNFFKSNLSVLGFLLLCLIWSSTWLFIKLGLETMPPFLSAGIRFFIAFLALAIYASILKLKFPRDIKSHLFFLLFGQAIFTISYGLVYWGEQYIDSGITSVLFSVMPFYTAILAPKMIPEEHMTRNKTIGIFIGLAGTLLIFGGQLEIGISSYLQALAMGGILVSPLFSAYGTILGKRAVKDFHPIILNTLPLLYASLSFLLISLFFENHSLVQFTGMAIFSLSYLAIMGTAVAFVVYFWMLKNTSAVMMSSITFITPPLALIWGWLALDEPISWKLIAGMIIIFTGIWFVRDVKLKETGK